MNDLKFRKCMTGNKILNRKVYGRKPNLRFSNRKVYVGNKINDFNIKGIPFLFVAESKV